LGHFYPFLTVKDGILSNYLNQNDIIDFIYGFCNGVTFATLALILIVTGRWGLKIREFKDGSLTAIFINELHFSA